VTSDDGVHSRRSMDQAIHFNINKIPLHTKLPGPVRCKPIVSIRSISRGNIPVLADSQNIFGSFNYSALTKSCCPRSVANLCTARSRPVPFSPVRENVPVVVVSSVSISALERRGELALLLLSLRAPSRSTPG